MAEVDIAKLRYVVKVSTLTEEMLDVTGLCTRVSFGDDKGGIAAKADITLANVKLEKGYLTDLVVTAQHCLVKIFANNELVFDGFVWDWNYTSSLEKELAITAYDRMIYLTQCKDYNYYSTGQTTKTIIQTLCDKWGIPLDYQWEEDYTHGKTKFAVSTISDQILKTLDEAQDKQEAEKRKYVALMINGTLVIRDRGGNSDIYEFHPYNIMSVSNRRSKKNLVTQVLVMGKAEEDTRPPILHPEEGDIKTYGTLQEIVTKDGDKSLEDAQKEAARIIAEKGKPEESVQISAVDVPVIRKGDKVHLTAGNQDGYFIVESVTHNAMELTMEMELTKA